HHAASTISNSTHRGRCAAIGMRAPVSRKHRARIRALTFPATSGRPTRRVKMSRLPGAGLLEVWSGGGSFKMFGCETSVKGRTAFARGHSPLAAGDLRPGRELKRP